MRHDHVADVDGGNPDLCGTVFGLAGCSIEWNCAPDSTKTRDRSSAMEAETNFAVDSRILQLRSSAASSSLCSTRNEPRISS
jgi:hypothetical protein